MKYKTIQTLMLPDSEEENYGLYYQGTEGVRLYLIYLEKGIANVLSSHFKIYLSFPCSARVCRRLRRMDGTIRGRYPEIYNAVENKFVWAIRKSGYLLYYPGHFIMRLREKLNEV